MKQFIDKLIERLEEEIDLNPIYDYEKGHSRAICDAIEIVNQLAEEYNNDFCEWKWGIDSAQVQCQGDRILFGSRRLFSYCPYCGKKIKEIK